MPNPQFDEQIAFLQGGGGQAGTPTDLDKLNKTFEILSNIGQKYRQKKDDKDKKLFEFRTKIAEAHPDSFKSAQEMQDFVSKGTSTRPVFSMVQPEGPATQSGTPPTPINQQTGTEPIQITSPSYVFDPVTKTFTMAPQGVTPKNVIKDATPKTSVPKKEKTLIPKSEYLKRTKSGEKLSANEYQVVDDTPKNDYADARKKQFIMSDLPSNQGQGKTAGAASQVALAATQGMALIAHPGSPQRLQLAASDLARTVQRSAPQLDSLKGAGYADNIITRLSSISQKITANPNAKDVPELRKDMYNIFKELRESSKPYINRQLNNLEHTWKGGLPENWEDIKKSELGEDIPDIEFEGEADPKQVASKADDILKKHGVLK